MDEQQKLEQDDKAYVWHPFTQMQDYLEERPLIIEFGDGVMLRDIYGKEYIDGVSSLWCNVHGHRKKEIDEAIKSQLDRVAHSTMLGLANIPAVELAAKLVEISPEGLSKVFYSDSGSEGVEIALKMAFQYWRQREAGPGEPDPKKKTKFVSLRNAYHGDTIGAVSVGGIDLFHSVYSPLLFDALAAPSPYCYRCELGAEPESCDLACLKKLEGLLESSHEQIAAMIVEPMIQAAGGMIVMPAGYLKGVEELCRRYGVLLIADEVATGFGRTGKMFACLHDDIHPDILVCAKGLTGGYLPLAATITTDEIFNGFCGEYRERKTFFHGHTYTGNPLACSAALASLSVFEEESVLEGLQQKIETMASRLARLSELEHVGDIRRCGFIAGIELVKDRETKEEYPWEDKIGVKVALEARKTGLIIRPLGNVIVIMPPLSISIYGLSRVINIIYDSIKAVTES